MSELDILARDRITSAIADVRTAGAEVAEALSAVEPFCNPACEGHSHLMRLTRANGKVAKANGLAICILLECQQDRVEQEKKSIRLGGTVGAICGVGGGALVMGALKGLSALAAAMSKHQ